MKPPSSDTEALRSEQSAPVCATDRLFVATDELGHFASVDDADVVGETSREAPRGVKDLRSITDPAAGSGARRARGPEVAGAISGLSR